MKTRKSQQAKSSEALTTLVLIAFALFICAVIVQSVSADGRSVAVVGELVDYTRATQVPESVWVTELTPAWFELYSEVNETVTVYAESWTDTGSELNAIDTVTVYTDAFTVVDCRTYWQGTDAIGLWIERSDGHMYSIYADWYEISHYDVESINMTVQWLDSTWVWTTSSKGSAVEYLTVQLTRSNEIAELVK